MFFCATPSLTWLAGFPTGANWVGAENPPPLRGMYAAFAIFQRPDPATLLPTIRSPVLVKRPHCGCCRLPPPAYTVSTLAVRSFGSNLMMVLFVGSQAYRR